jgi:DNA-binding transcriptional LysR family regulator
MNLKDKDLNLLVLFLAIWEERNLHLVGQRLFLSQSAISHALNRLRDQLGDPLFVRSSRGVIPTDFASSLVAETYKIVGQLESLYQRGKSFSPKECERTLYLATGELFDTSYLQKFSSLLEKEAPKVKMICYPVSALFTPERFEREDLHLAVSGFFGVDLKEGFFSKELLKDDISCLHNKDHKELGEKLNLDTYLKLEHVFVSVEGSSSGMVDRTSLKGKKRQVMRVVPSFLAAAVLVKKSRMVLTGPDSINQVLAKSLGLKVSPLPFVDLKLSVKMYWHQRTHQDEFLIWVRNLVEKVVMGT